MAVQFNKKFASIAGAFLLVVSLVVSGFVIEDRYNNQKHHDKDLSHERELVAASLKEIQTQQQISNRQSDYRYYSSVLEDIERKILELTRVLAANPNNQNAKNDLEYYKQKKAKVRQKLDSLMGN